MGGLPAYLKLEIDMHKKRTLIVTTTRAHSKYEQTLKFMSKDISQLILRSRMYYLIFYSIRCFWNLRPDETLDDFDMKRLLRWCLMEQTVGVLLMLVLIYVQLGVLKINSEIWTGLQHPCQFLSNRRNFF